MSCPGTWNKMELPKGSTDILLKLGFQCLFMHICMPLRYWVKSFITCNYLINRLPTPVLDMETLFCKLFGKSPDYILKTFGYRCFPYLRNYASHKLQPCVFIGYNHHHKSYCCLHKMVYIFRHVVFDEYFFTLYRSH